MRYGSIGQGPLGPEVFLPGSFGDLSQGGNTPERAARSSPADSQNSPDNGAQ